jgi:hypothetical protein|tara:strand:- start:2212 stop:3162 length:951 start_codon:yes stop_codon:yes gene_type:complete
MKRKKVIWLFKTERKSREDLSAAAVFWYGVLENMGYEVVYQNYYEYNAEEFYNSAKAYNPDFIICANYMDYIHTEFQRLREFSKVFLLTSDMHRFYESNVKFWIPFVDGIINFEGTKEWALRDGLSEKGFLKMRWGFNPNTMTTNVSEKTNEIYHYGGLHGNRQELLGQFQIKGKNVLVNQDIFYEEVKQNLAESKYSICFSQNAVGDRQELKGRVIEIPAHSVLLTEYAPELKEYYNDDEMILFNSVDDAIEKINYYNSNQKEYDKLLHNGKRALWNRNTAYHEWNKILPNMDEDFKPLDVIKLLKEKHGDYYYE